MSFIKHYSSLKEDKLNVNSDVGAGIQLPAGTLIYICSNKKEFLDNYKNFIVVIDELKKLSYINTFNKNDVKSIREIFFIDEKENEPQPDYRINSFINRYNIYIEIFPGLRYFAENDFLTDNELYIQKEKKVGRLLNIGQ